MFRFIVVLLIGLLIAPVLTDICGWPGIVLLLVFFSFNININREY